MCTITMGLPWKQHQKVLWSLIGFPWGQNLIVGDEMNFRSTAAMNIKFPVSRSHMELNEERDEEKLKLKSKSWAREMAQIRVLYKHEDLRLMSSTHVNKPGMAAQACCPSIGRQRGEPPWSLPVRVSSLSHELQAQWGTEGTVRDTV